MSSKLNRQIVKQTKLIPKEDLLIEPAILIGQEPYLLREIEFMHISRGKPTIFTVANSIVFIEIAYFFNFLPKLYNQYFNNRPTMISEGDWYTLLIGIIIIVIVYIYALQSPNDYKVTIKQIKNHFENAKPIKQFGGRNGK